MRLEFSQNNISITLAVVMCVDGDGEFRLGWNHHKDSPSLNNDCSCRR